MTGVWGKVESARGRLLRHAPELQNVCLTELRMVEQATVSLIGEV